MASPEEFHFFAKLPSELRIITWEMSILRHHRDRVVFLNELTKRIICIQKLACSSHFRATSESRQVAIHLYPIRLPVSWAAVWDVCLREDTVVDDDTETDMSKYRPEGVVYVSLKHDIFAIGVDRLAEWFLTSHASNRPPLGGSENFGYRSQALSLLQYQCVRRIMLFNRYYPSMLKDGCLRSLYWYVILEFARSSHSFSVVSPILYQYHVHSHTPSLR